MPAHVPKAGMPPASRPATASNSPDDSSSIDIVVDSPPGRTSASTLVELCGRRGPRPGSAPRRASISACRAEAPCRANTPTFTPAACVRVSVAVRLHVGALHLGAS